MCAILLLKLKWLSSSCNNCELVRLSVARASGCFKRSSGSAIFFSNLANPSSIFFFSVSIESTTLFSLEVNFDNLGSICVDFFSRAAGIRAPCLVYLVSVDTNIGSTSLLGELGRVL